MYVRQVKQLIRAVEPQFDERRFGFGSLVEALKHCQREGVLRLERDRQGVVRVWPAGPVQKTPTPGEGRAAVDGIFEEAGPAAAAADASAHSGPELGDFVPAHATAADSPAAGVEASLPLESQPAEHDGRQEDWRQAAESGTIAEAEFVEPPHDQAEGSEARSGDMPAESPAPPRSSGRRRSAGTRAAARPRKTSASPGRVSTASRGTRARKPAKARGND
jgi:hypothetical protein